MARLPNKGLSINVNLEQRPAEYTAPWNKPKHGIKKGQVIPVQVFGLFQVKTAEDTAAYFVVELPNGKCMHVAPDTIRFTDRGDM